MNEEGNTISVNFETEVRRLEGENRSLNRKLTINKTAMDRNKLYIAAKEQMLTALAEEKAKQEKYFNLFLGNTQDLMVLLDHEMRIVYCSDSFLNRINVRDFSAVNGLLLHEAFLGKVEQETIDFIQVSLGMAASTRNTLVLEQALDIGLWGKHRHYRISITPMVNEHRESEGMLIIFTDETEVIEAKEAAERAQKQAEAANRAKSAFLAQMSHEIRTPLNAVIGMSELAIRDAGSPTFNVRECLVNIRQAGSNLLSIINDVLDLSKIESGSFQLTPAPYHFSSLINNVISVIHIRLVEKPILFLVNANARIPNSLIGDETRIRQILLNLLSNAAKYTHKGFIKFSTWHEIEDKQKARIYFEVADSGIGIKEEDISKLFSDFIRIDMERNREIEGTGLGLAITKRLCQEMEGDITVSSEYGKGSVFTAVISQTFSGSDPLACVENPERKRVLLYDERPLYAESVAATLTNLGVDTTLTANPGDFLAELEKDRHPYTFVSTDLVTDAISLIHRIKGRTTLALLAGLGETSSFQNVPVIMMPAYVVPMANLLNGVTVSPEFRKTVVRFTAPEAKILIVDDILTNLKVAQGLLVPYRMKVDICDNGRGAIDMVKENRYDIIFMDYMMPGMDGMETAAHIRAQEGEYFSRVPIIALTAYAIAGMKEMFLSKGFDDYLAKPIEISRLNALVEKWIPQEKRLKTGNAAAEPSGPRDKADDGNRPVKAVLNQPMLYKLKQALETEHTGTIDIIMDQLIMMPLAEDEKNALQEIWDHILASEFRLATDKVDRLIYA
jgi:signal transduction histidine kinase/CheY-like chemotaxis protein